MRHWCVLLIEDAYIYSQIFLLHNFYEWQNVELDLFKFAEEVNEIVDGAAKEAKIEIKLNNI